MRTATNGVLCVAIDDLFVDLAVIVPIFRATILIKTIRVKEANNYVRREV